MSYIKQISLNEPYTFFMPKCLQSISKFYISNKMQEYILFNEMLFFREPFIKDYIKYNFKCYRSGKVCLFINIHSHELTNIYLSISNAAGNNHISPSLCKQMSYVFFMMLCSEPATLLSVDSIYSNISLQKITKLYGSQLMIIYRDPGITTCVENSSVIIHISSYTSSLISMMTSRNHLNITFLNIFSKLLVCYTNFNIFIKFICDLISNNFLNINSVYYYWTWSRSIHSTSLLYGSNYSTSNHCLGIGMINIKSMFYRTTFITALDMNIFYFGNPEIWPWRVYAQGSYNMFSKLHSNKIIDIRPYRAYAAGGYHTTKFIIKANIYNILHQIYEKYLIFYHRSTSKELELCAWECKEVNLSIISFVDRCCFIPNTRKTLHLCQSRSCMPPSFAYGCNYAMELCIQF